jgi:NADH dehydrogenase
MKTVQESLTIRSEVMRRFEDLCRFEDKTRLKIVVVGGGPTGVETSGALAELVRGPLKEDNQEAARLIDIYLIEAGPRLLPMFAESLTTRSKKYLEKLGVNVLLNTAVSSVESGRINFASGEAIDSQVIIWAAGVKGSPALAELNLPTVGGRLDTLPTLQVNEYPYIFAVGDCGGVKGPTGRPLPQVAPVAMQTGRFTAKQILRLAKGEAVTDFKYVDKGSMATIGRNKAIIQVKKLKLYGPVAWVGWLFLHLFYLLGGRNKISTIADWTWNYFTFDRGNRNIFDQF